MTGVRLFVGGDAGTVQGEPQTLTGDRCFTGAIRPKTRLRLPDVDAILDSGAFSDPPDRRLTPSDALQRQLDWERKANEFCGYDDWHVRSLVSYDRLIDETWSAGVRHKQRWTLAQADGAVRETVDAAHFLAKNRQWLAPRGLLLAAQGVDALQYAECAAGVLQAAELGDWFGFGGWCILGRFTSWLPEFWRTIRLVLPMVKVAGLSHVHIFGVLYPPALGGLLWLCNEYGLNLSTDSSAPMMSCTWKNKRKAGARRDYWRDNVAWWVDYLAGLRATEHYREPPDLKPQRQLGLGL